MKVRPYASIAMAIAVVSTWACSESPIGPVGGEVASPNFAAVSQTTGDVHPIADFTVDLGDSRILRTSNGVNAMLKTTELAPGFTYTLWAVIFNDGDATNDGGAFDAVRFVDGKVADYAGRATFSGRVMANDGGGELFGELTDPAVAEVHLVVRRHGPVDPAFMPDQINSFAGGCTPETSFDLGNGPYDCEDVQVAIHASAS